MENTAVKLNPAPLVKLKEVRKELAEKLSAALADQKSLLGEAKWGKHIKKVSKSLAEDVVKAAHKLAKKKPQKAKKKEKKSK